MAVYFLKFTAINANANSFSTFDFPLTDNRETDKLAYNIPKTGSTSILRFLYMSPVSSSESLVLIYSFCCSHFSFINNLRLFPSFAFVQIERNGQSLQFSD